MKKGIPVLTILSLLALAISIYPVYAATVISPATSGTVAGTASVLNASQTTLNGLVNCTFYTQSADTANSSWANLGFIANISANMSSLNMSFNSNVIEDDNSYIFNATCRNSANAQSTQVTTTSVTVDNTVPSAPTSLSPVNNNVNGTTAAKDFTATVTNGQTTQCNLIIAKDSPNLDNSDAYGYSAAAATYSAANCTGSRTFTRNELGRWYWRIQASDGTNYTNSSVFRIDIDQAGAGGPVGGIPPQAQQRAGFTAFLDRISAFIRNLFRR